MAFWIRSARGSSMPSAGLARNEADLMPRLATVATVMIGDVFSHEFDRLDPPRAAAALAVLSDLRRSDSG